MAELLVADDFTEVRSYYGRLFLSLKPSGYDVLLRIRLASETKTCTLLTIIILLTARRRNISFQCAHELRVGWSTCVSSSRAKFSTMAIMRSSYCLL